MIIMKIKNFIVIFSVFIMLMCCVSSISAASDDVMNTTLSEVDSVDGSISVSNDDQVIGVEDSASVAQGNDDKLSGQSHDDPEEPVAVFSLKRHLSIVI